MAVSQETLLRIHRAFATARLRKALLLDDEVAPRVLQNDLMEVLGEFALAEEKLKRMLALALECGADDGVEEIMALTVADLDPKEVDR